MMKLTILLLVGVIARQAYGDEPEAIVGGQTAYQGQFPYQISLRYGGSHTCGGSIIGPKHILTAAHCVHGRTNPSSYTVVTGAHHVRSGGQAYRVKCIQIHPAYNSPFYNNNDIAVITLTTAITMNAQTRAIGLASRDYSNSNTNVVLSGWGQLGARAGIPDYLQWITLKTIPTAECQRYHGGQVSSNQVCTYVGHGKGACMGDSGGPLANGNEVVGVVSWGSPCAVGRPDVFTNVYQYRSWIQQCIQTCP